MHFVNYNHRRCGEVSHGARWAATSKAQPHLPNLSIRQAASGPGTSARWHYCRSIPLTQPGRATIRTHHKGSKLEGARFRAG
jgi:hypothetical protein